MEKDPETKNDMKEAAERIEKMIQEGKRIVEDARREARELKKQAREERRAERKARHHSRHHHKNRKKEKVLNLRIGKDLEDRIKTEAEKLNIPVSNLVRNILDDAFELVEDLGENVSNLVEDVVGNAENIAENFKSAVKDYVAAGEKAGSEADVKDVSAWQEIKMGKDGNCSKCDESIHRGSKAHMGFTDRTGKRMFLCGSCIDSVEA